MNTLDFISFFRNRDNNVLIELYQNSVEVNYTTLTKAEIRWSGGSLNSVDHPTLVSIDTVNGIRLKLGTASPLNQATTVVPAKLIIYSASFPNGVVWDAKLSLKFFDA